MKYLIIILLIFNISILFVSGQGGAIESLSNNYDWCENQKVGCKCSDNVDFWSAIIEKDFVKYHPKKTLLTDTNIYKNYCVDSLFDFIRAPNHRHFPPIDSILKYSDNNFRKALFEKTYNYVKRDSAKIEKQTSTCQKASISGLSGTIAINRWLIKMSNYLKNKSTLNFLKNVVYKSKDNRLVVEAALALIKYNEKELAFNTFKKLWFKRNSESYTYFCHEGFKALNNEAGIKFLKFAALDTVVCVSFDACVKLIELGHSSYSKPIIEKHLNSKYRLISVYLLLKHYYTPETISMVKDLLNKTTDEDFKYCGNLLLKKYEQNIVDY